MAELDKHIVGQAAAKRAVAGALRNRWRRHHLPPHLRHDVTPKNILMIGPTGCGKTEIARRLAKITDSPFIKVEATKFTEVGFYGRDVDSIIKDLARQTVPELRARRKQRYQERVNGQAEDAILDAIMQRHAAAPSATTAAAVAAAAAAAAAAPTPTTTRTSTPTTPPSASAASPVAPTTAASTTSASPAAASTVSEPSTRDEYRAHLRAGLLETFEIEIELPSTPPSSSSSSNSASSSSPSSSGSDNSPPAVIVQILSGGVAGKSSFFSRATRRLLPIKDARPLLVDAFLSKLVSNEDLSKLAVKAIEENGIVFLDEIDKVVSPSSSGMFKASADASAEGVQRDLLPLIEGCAVSTSIGVINTDHVLWITSGAFHAVKPGDLLPELQGRLPVKVELKGLDEDDLYRILTVPVANLLRQQVELLRADHIELEWSDAAVREIARVAAEVNRTVENIGARRLNTVISKIIEEVSFQAADMPKGTKIRIEKEEVVEKVRPLMERGDLRKYIL